MVSFYDFKAARDIMTVNDAKYLVKIYRKKGLGSDTRETCCLFDKFQSLIDFS